MVFKGLGFIVICAYHDPKVGFLGIVLAEGGWIVAAIVVFCVCVGEVSTLT